MASITNTGLRRIGYAYQCLVKKCEQFRRICVSVGRAAAPSDMSESTAANRGAINNRMTSHRAGATAWVATARMVDRTNFALACWAEVCSIGHITSIRDSGINKSMSLLRQFPGAPGLGPSLISNRISHISKEFKFLIVQGEFGKITDVVRRKICFLSV